MQEPFTTLDRHPLRIPQSGFMLLEVLLAILLISFGILGLAGLQASTISAASDARYRSEASYLIDQLIAQIQTSVSRSGSGVDSASLAPFVHNPNGSTCGTFDGAAATSAVVTNWIARVTNAGSTSASGVVTAATGLPGTTADDIQILVDTAASNRVTVSICWLEPGISTAHRQSTVAYIN